MTSTCLRLEKNELYLRNSIVIQWPTFPFKGGNFAGRYEQRLLGLDLSHPCPPTILEGDISIPNPAYDSLVSCDQLLISLLIASLSEEFLPLVR